MSVSPSKLMSKAQKAILTVFRNGYFISYYCIHVTFEKFRMNSRMQSGWSITSCITKNAFTSCPKTTLFKKSFLALYVQMRHDETRHCCYSLVNIKITGFTHHKSVNLLQTYLGWIFYCVAIHSPWVLMNGAQRKRYMVEHYRFAFWLAGREKTFSKVEWKIVEYFHSLCKRATSGDKLYKCQKKMHNEEERGNF